MIDKLHKIDNNKNFGISDKHLYIDCMYFDMPDIYQYIEYMHLDKIDNN